MVELIRKNKIFRICGVNMKNTKSKKDTKKFFEYKGKPLVRCGDVMYYGNMKDKYVARIQSTNYKIVADTQIASLVKVDLIDTSDDLSCTKKIIKTSEKSGLYPALDIAATWMNRASAE